MMAIGPVCCAAWLASVLVVDDNNRKHNAKPVGC
jgi:hypothetical protein